MASRVGILGGTFDPVHYGHLRAAEEVLEALCLDRILFIPAASPPHKPRTAIQDFQHRWEMLRLAVGDHPRFELSDVESRIAGKSYTVVTLRTLRELLGGEGEVHLYLLVGMDSFQELSTWWRYRELFQLASLVVLRRPGHSEELIGELLAVHVSPLYAWRGDACLFAHPRLLPVHVVSNTVLGISSTQIRWLAAQGKSIRYLAPREVLRYIAREKLYSASSW
ncbi:MAG: nicotinate-nucleotide adenylyltransferase [Syntrophobacteraceae bacterium]|jgi:nicotinate-nucleotide adenylyltransferase|nr:nicotinate-nucleotide adenylyltransferase [Syntrophobacteraceae bacterium]